MFYDQLKKACKENNTSITAVLKKLKIGTANGTYWKNGSSPSADIVVKLSEFLGVSCDYLLMGKETMSKVIEMPKASLTENETELLNLFKHLSDREQLKLIGKVEGMVEENQKNNLQENVG